MSDGETPHEAVKNVMDAIACWIEAAEEMADRYRPRRVPTQPE
jgi:antitoxin HicB